MESVHLLLLDSPVNEFFLQGDSLLSEQNGLGLRRRLSLVEKKNRRRATLHNENNSDLPRARHREMSLRRANTQYKLLAGRERAVVSDELIPEYDDASVDKVTGLEDLADKGDYRWPICPEVYFVRDNGGGSYTDGTRNTNLTNPSLNTSGDPYLKTVPLRVRRDLKPNASKKYQKAPKKPSRNMGGSTQYLRLSYDSETGKLRREHGMEKRKKPFKQRYKTTSSPFPLQSVYRKNDKSGTKIPLEERLILNVGGVYRACNYISEYKAKSQHFSHPNPEINEAVQLILNYVQSRVDRGLKVDNKKIVNGQTYDVNQRLASWAESRGARIINLHDLLIGRLISVGESAYKFKFIPVQTDIRVSHSYEKHPEKYILTPNQLLSAVRRCLSGKIQQVGYFHILDPTTRVTLEWCIDQHRSGFSDFFKAGDVAAFRVPELKAALKAQGVLDVNGNPIVYRYHFSQRSYEYATRKPYVLPQERVQHPEYRVKKNWFVANLFAQPLK